MPSFFYTRRMIEVDDLTLYVHLLKDGIDPELAVKLVNLTRIYEHSL